VNTCRSEAAVRRHVLVLAGVALLVASPALVRADPAPACTVASGARLVTAAAAYSGTIPTPKVPAQVLDATAQPIPEESISRQTVVIDLGPEIFPKTTGEVDIALSWGDATDFDLFVKQDSQEIGSSGAFNPIDGTGESVFLSGVRHCDTLVIEAINFTGNPLATLHLDATISKIRK
jgi:hypothetical protein